MIKTKNLKKSYTISCSSQFRDKVDVLCRKKKVNAADIARSVILTMPKDIIENIPDPGEPLENDREPFKTSNGGKTYKRKPRIQLRLQDEYDPSFIRKSLNFALLLDNNSLDVFAKSEETDRLKAMVNALMFEVSGSEIGSRAEAFYILGLNPTSNPGPAQLKQRFRLLATIHHPDSQLGSHERMSKLNEAMEYLMKNYY